MLLRLYLVYKKSLTIAKGLRQKKDLCSVVAAMSTTAAASVAIRGLDDACGVQVKSRSCLEEGSISNHQPLSPVCSMEWKTEWGEESKVGTLGKSKQTNKQKVKV